MKLGMLKWLFTRKHSDTCMKTHPESRAIFCLRRRGHEGEHQASADALIPNDDGSDFSMSTHPYSVAWL